MRRSAVSANGMTNRSLSAFRMPKGWKVTCKTVILFGPREVTKGLDGAMGQYSRPSARLYISALRSEHTKAMISVLYSPGRRSACSCAVASRNGNRFRGRGVRGRLAPNSRLKRLPPHMESEFYFRKYETVLGSAELPR